MFISHVTKPSIAAVVLSLIGCGVYDRCPHYSCSHLDYGTEFVQAQRTVDLDAEDPTPTPPQPKTMPLPTTQPADESSEDTTDTLETIDEANRSSTARSTEDGFVSATQFFDYFPGTLYEVVACPGYITTLVLAKGEQLLTKASGDTTRWIVEETGTGQGLAAQTLVMIKPTRPWLKTNLVLTTNSRVYQLQLSSVPDGVYNATVAWNYPTDGFVLPVSAPGSPGPPGTSPGYGGQDDGTIAPVQLSQICFDYEIVPEHRYRRPRWAPVRAFHDGKRTYIEFPSTLGVTEAPPLFVSGHQGDAQLVNYRVNRNYYIVDRVLDNAQLRLGDTPQQVVHIRRVERRENRTDRWDLWDD